MSPEEVAGLTGKDRRTIYTWLRNGQLPAKKIGRTWLVKQQDLP